MSEANTVPNATEHQKPADADSKSVFDWGVLPLLNAQADLLAGAETTVANWLRRRHEAVADTRQLVASMHVGTDLGDALKASREFMSRSFRRLAADADACHATAQHFMERAPSWFPEGVWHPGNGADLSATRAAATRAAARPLRMANRSE